MFEGANLQLTPPQLDIKSQRLMNNPEVQSMLNDLTKYFNQKHKIYDAELILSNNDYMIVNGEFGAYRKRIDTIIKLRYLTKIIIYRHHISFKCNTEEYTVEITSNFFYFIEWEDLYYQ